MLAVSTISYFSYFENFNKLFDVNILPLIIVYTSFIYFFHLLRL